jgi:UDPglucose--hexose-1-phosphate uridylyltransferase
MEDEKIFDVFSAFKERFVELSRIEDIKYVQIFKNHGRNGGASIRHSHSQIVAMPFIPPRIQLELEGAHRYYQSDGKCAYCEIIKKEIGYQQRLLCKNEHFIAVLAFAPRFAYETWIIPLDHQAVFSEADDASIISLVSIYKKIMEMFTNILGEFPYNLVVHTAPYHFTDQYYHWHIELIPRVTYHAGFELATGACISVISPEEAARIIKKEV